MYRKSNFNKDSYQVLDKNLGLCLMKKRSSRTHKECLNNFFWPKIFITNALCVNVHKMYECKMNQMPCCNVIFFQKVKFLGILGVLGVSFWGSNAVP